VGGQDALAETLLERALPDGDPLPGRGREGNERVALATLLEATRALTPEARERRLHGLLQGGIRDGLFVSAAERLAS